MSRRDHEYRLRAAVREDARQRGCTCHPHIFLHRVGGGQYDVAEDHANACPVTDEYPPDHPLSEYESLN